MTNNEQSEVRPEPCGQRCYGPEYDSDFECLNPKGHTGPHEWQMVSRASVVAPPGDAISRQAVIERCRELEPMFNGRVAGDVVMGLRQFVEALPAATSVSTPVSTGEQSIAATTPSAASSIVDDQHRNYPRAIALLRALRNTRDPAEVKRQIESWNQLNDDLAPPAASSEGEQARCLVCDTPISAGFHFCAKCGPPPDTDPAPSTSEVIRAAVDEMAGYFDPYFKIQRDWKDQVAAILSRYFGHSAAAPGSPSPADNERVARWAETYAEGVESQNEVTEAGRIENWSDFHAGQVYAAKQISAALRTSVGEESK